MPRKRARGGGRRPKGEFANKSMTFTTRITPETRAALQRAADRRKVSVSQYAECLLRLGLQKPTHAQRRNRALGHAIARLAENIERSTGESWRTDDFAGQALTYAIGSLMLHLTPPIPERVKTPRTVETIAAKMPDEFAALFRAPAGHGHIAAHAIIAKIERSMRTGEPDEWSAPINLQLLDELAHDIGRDLMLTGRSKVK
jgi:hypothetical protein